MQVLKYAEVLAIHHDSVWLARFVQASTKQRPNHRNPVFPGLMHSIWLQLKTLQARDPEFDYLKNGLATAHMEGNQNLADLVCQLFIFAVDCSCLHVSFLAYAVPYYPWHSPLVDSRACSPMGIKGWPHHTATWQHKEHVKEQMEQSSHEMIAIFCFS